jgi:hypothetical protein
VHENNLPARRCLQRQVWQGETDDASALEMQRSSALSTWRGEDFGLTVIVGGSGKALRATALTKWLGNY